MGIHCERLTISSGQTYLNGVLEAPSSSMNLRLSLSSPVDSTRTSANQIPAANSSIVERQKGRAGGRGSSECSEVTGSYALLQYVLPKGGWSVPLTTEVYRPDYTSIILPVNPFNQTSQIPCWFDPDNAGSVSVNYVTSTINAFQSWRTGFIVMAIYGGLLVLAVLYAIYCRR
jgi:hypothetical protein